jgi:hypothetical protein
MLDTIRIQKRKCSSTPSVVAPVTAIDSSSSLKSWLVIFTIANEKSMADKVSNNVTMRTKRTSDNPESILEITFIFNKLWKREIMLLLFLFRGIPYGIIGEEKQQGNDLR